MAASTPSSGPFPAPTRFPLWQKIVPCLPDGALAGADLMLKDFGPTEIAALFHSGAWPDVASGLESFLNVRGALGRIRLLRFPGDGFGVIYLRGEFHAGELEEVLETLHGGCVPGSEDAVLCT